VRSARGRATIAVAGDANAESIAPAMRSVKEIGGAGVGTQIPRTTRFVFSPGGLKGLSGAALSG
jgi:hypothetical protein